MEELFGSDDDEVYPPAARSPGAASSILESAHLDVGNMESGFWGPSADPRRGPGNSETRKLEFDEYPLENLYTWKHGIWNLVSMLQGCPPPPPLALYG